MNRDIFRRYTDLIEELIANIRAGDFKRAEGTLSLLNSILEPMIEMDSASSRHRIKTSIASIRTALEMLMASGLSEGDKDELKRLAHKGVVELTERINGVL